MKRVFGRQTRLSLGGERKIWAPALATHPVPTVVTGARMKRIMSWIASPDSTWPPGEDMTTVMGASDASDRARRRRQIERATASSTSPKSRTNLDLNESCSSMRSAPSFLGDCGGSDVALLVFMLAPEVKDDTVLSQAQLQRQKFAMRCRCRSVLQAVL